MADDVLNPQRVHSIDLRIRYSQLLRWHRQLIARKWTYARKPGRVVLIPERAPNANAYAERFVRSIKEECLDRIVPIGERHFRRAVAEFVEHYHRERNHQGLDN